jgi:CheY-like chemotaxis protein
MSLSYSLGAIRMLIGEPNSQVRSSYRSALFGVGLRRIEDCSSAIRTQEILSEQIFDLIVLDADMEDSDILGIVHSIREKKLGKDPFVNVVLIADPPSSDRARQLVSSGADALLIRPASVHLLHERINQLIESRRPFVVTQDYVGPERGKEIRPGVMPIPRVQVPSSLRNRAFGKTDDDIHLKSVAETWDIIKRQRIERLIYQIGWLANRILPVGREDDVHSVRSKFLQQLGTVTETLVQWLTATKNEELYAACVRLKKNAQSISSHRGSSEESQLFQALLADAGKIDELWKSDTKAIPP